MNGWEGSVYQLATGPWDYKDTEAATEAQIRSLLSNVSGIYIRGKFSSALDTGYLDNVRPEVC
jgi:hypothetical protein